VLAFHVNVGLLTPIVFLSPMILLAVFSFPWPRALARLRGRPSPVLAEPDAPPFDLAPSRSRRVAFEALAVAAILVLVAWLSPLRAYTLRHHDGRRGPPSHEAPASKPPTDVAALLGGLGLGDSIASLRVARVQVRDNHALVIELDAGNGASMRATIARSGVLGFHAPRATGAYEIFYESVRGVDDATRDAVLDAIAERLRRTERDVPVPEGM